MNLGLEKEGASDRKENNPNATAKLEEEKKRK